MKIPRNVRLLATILFATSVVAYGDALKFDKLLDYENVSVIKILPDGIRIMHSGGVTKIPVEMLPEGIRTELGLSEDDAKEYRGSLAQKKKSALERSREAKLRLAAGKAVAGTITQVLPNGILVQSKRISGYPEKEKYKKWTRKVIRYSFFEGESFPVRERVPVQWETDKTYFIYCDTTGMVDGGRFEFLEAFEAGAYKYTSVLSAPKTVAALTPDFDQRSRSKSEK